MQKFVNRDDLQWILSTLQ